MTSVEDEIRTLIESEIKGDLSVSNWHGVDLKKCLIKPYLETCEDSFKEGETLDVYTVLKEFPDKEDGYHIVYDPSLKKFGLTVPGRGKFRLFLGYYGSFIDTLKGM